VWLCWVVCVGVEYFVFGCEEYCYGLVFVVGYGDGCFYVDGVDVRAFLVVDFDVDEVVVYECCGGVVFE